MRPTAQTLFESLPQTPVQTVRRYPLLCAVPGAAIPLQDRARPCPQPRRCRGLLPQTPVEVSRSCCCSGGSKHCHPTSGSCRHSPTAHTLLASLPQTPKSISVVPLDGMLQVLPFQLTIVPFVPTAQTLFASRPQMPVREFPCGSGFCHTHPACAAATSGNASSAATTAGQQQQHDR